MGVIERVGNIATSGDMISPYAVGVVTVPTGYYTVCRLESDIPAQGSTVVPADVLSATTAGVFVSSSKLRACCGIACSPGFASVVFSDSSVVSLGRQAAGSDEWRWYWDSEHPEAYIQFVLHELGLGGCIQCADIDYCLGVSVCDAPGVLAGGSIDVTLSTGLLSITIGVGVEATWV